MSVEHPSAIANLVEAQHTNLMSYKVVDGDTIYLSDNDFGGIELRQLPRIIAKMADFASAFRGDVPTLIHPIQVNHCRAPEVLLGAGWSYSADVWNFGVMVRSAGHVSAA